jgi:hypothetical protein
VWCIGRGAEIATRFLLHRYRSLLESAFEEGSLNARSATEAIISEKQRSYFRSVVLACGWLLTCVHVVLVCREFEGCIKECDSSMVKLYDHAHAEAATPMMAVLSSVPFLRYSAITQRGVHRNRHRGREDRAIAWIVI